MQLKQWQLIAMGLLSTIVVLALLNAVLPASSSGLIAYYVVSFLGLALAFGVGGFVAKQAFTLPAVIFAVAWVTIVILQTAYLASQHSLPVIPILLNNLSLYLVWGLPAVVGSKLGMMLRSANSSRDSVAS